MLYVVARYGRKGMSLSRVRLRDRVCVSYSGPIRLAWCEVGSMCGEAGWMWERVSEWAVDGG